MINRAKEVLPVDEIRVIKEFIEYNKSLTRVKRFLGLDPVSWALHYFQNKRIKRVEEDVRAMKHKIHAIHRNTQLNQQQILRNFDLINLTSIEIEEHWQLLLKLDRLSHQNAYGLEQLINRTQFFEGAMWTLESIKAQTNTFQLGITAVTLDQQKLSRYLETLSRHTLTSELISPSDLRKILRWVHTSLSSCPQLELPTDPEENIWEYYETLRISTMILSGYLIVSIKVPLIDKSIKLKVY